MEVIRHSDRNRFKMDFLLFGNGASPYIDEIQRLGCRIIVCASPRRPYRFAHSFNGILTTLGPYDIVHSHVYFSSGSILRQAAAAGVPVRIAHSHMGGEDRSETPLRMLYRRVMARWISKYATHRLGCSKPAGDLLFGPGWDCDHHFEVLHCGIDLRLFEHAGDNSARKELGIADDAIIVGHVGRFVPQKNHSFLLKVAKELASLESNIRVLLIGDGPLRHTVEAQVSALGLAEKIVFAGVRVDIPRLMMSAMDVFVLPSVHEGLGIVGLEAQAAGLPCIFSTPVPREVQVLHHSTTFLPLSRSPRFWAEQILASVSLGRTPRARALRALKRAGFCVRDCVNRLLDIYEESSIAQPGAPQPTCAKPEDIKPHAHYGRYSIL